MKISLRTRIVLTNLASILCVVCVLELVAGLALRPIFVQDTKRQMRELDNELKALLLEQEPDEDSVNTCIQETQDKEMLNTQVLAEDGEILFASSPNRRSRRAVQERMQDILELYDLSGEQILMIDGSQDDDEEVRRMYLVERLDNGLSIIISRRVYGIDQQVRLVKLFLLIAGIGMAILAVFLSSLLIRSFRRALERMSDVTRSMANLDFTEKVHYSGEVIEMDVLASSIDRLSSELECSLRDMKQEVDRQQTLLRNLAHEIRTPLTTIRGYTETLKLLLPEHERTQRYCTIMEEECDALNRLSAELLEVAALRRGEDRNYETEDVVIGDFCLDLCQRIRHEYKKEDIRVDMEDGTVVSNELLLEQAIFNYLGNAVKYRTPDTQIRLTGRWESAGYRITVTNEGPEIPEEERTEIWNEFYRCDRSRKRSGSYGIGLAIVKQAALYLGASVGVDCEDGRTTFYILLRNSGR